MMPRERALLLGAAVLALGSLILFSFGPTWRPSGALPPDLVDVELVEDLGASLATWDVSAPEGERVRTGTIQPGHEFVLDRGPRPAFVTPPGSVLRVRRRLAAGAALAFAVGVQGRGVRDTAAAGLRFDVEIDGRPTFSRTLNPAAHRDDRAWVDDELDLGITSTREVELVLRTSQVGKGKLAGTAGWNHVRLLRRERLPRQRSTPDAPNVLVLLVDTLRADRLGCYGAVPTPSPVLDDLARHGIRFEQAIAQASWTMPSVATLLTGLHPRSHGATGGDDDPGGGVHNALPDAVTTLAETVSRAGITTVAVSSNPLVSRGTNYAQGFETFVEFGLRKDAAGFNDWAPATEVNRVFLEWLRANPSYRFFGYLHYMEPHHPYTPAPAHTVRPGPDVRPAVADGDLGEWSKALSSPAGLRLPEPEVRYLRELYDGEIATWDDALAELLDGLDRLGARERTILIVTADHGEEFQEHGRLAHGWHLYDELLHVPLVVVGPGIAPGVRQDEVQGIDLFPTVTARLGLPPATTLPGRDVLGPVEERAAISEIQNGVTADLRAAALTSIRTSAWKLIAAPTLGSFELFDIARDPAETRNRYGEDQAGAELAAALEAFGRTAAPPPAASANADPQLHEKLRALGYAQ